MCVTASQPKGARAEERGQTTGLTGSDQMEPRERFDGIAEALVLRFEDTEHGKMMSHDAVKVGGSVAFYFADGAVVFKLGEGADPGVAYSHPQPVKSKPPMKAWYRVEADDAMKWSDLALKSARFLRS